MVASGMTPPDAIDVRVFLQKQISCLHTAVFLSCSTCPCICHLYFLMRELVLGRQRNWRHRLAHR